MRRNHQHCAYHCRACGGHFASLGAFERHRQFDEGHKDDWDFRICVEPDDDRKTFEPADRNGICRLSGMGGQVELQPVTVWRERKTEAEVERLRLLRLRHGGPQNAQNPPDGVAAPEPTSGGFGGKDGGSAP